MPTLSRTIVLRIHRRLVLQRHVPQPVETLHQRVQEPVIVQRPDRGEVLPLDGRELALIQDHVLVGPAVGARRRHAPAQALAELLLEHPDEAPALRLRLPALLRVGVDLVGHDEQVRRGVGEPALRAHEARLGRQQARVRRPPVAVPVVRELAHVHVGGLAGPGGGAYDDLAGALVPRVQGLQEQDDGDVDLAEEAVPAGPEVLALPRAPR
ncbi:uncharacterized protein PG986_011348 [Apiospora aurea]|uniref:Uncharacterized protein n=1 Tax=Apiospora aurea TaxID=335848 RepID=A0ABR1Q4V6_9PEZI